MRIALIVSLIAALLAVPAVAGGQEAPEALNFWAPMSGDEENPPVDTEATGVSGMHLNDAETQLRFRVIVANIEDVTMAHIHCGAPGVNGPVVAWLYPDGPPPVLIPGRSDGILAEGTITADDVVAVPDSEACPGGVADFEELIAKMRSGDTYVNVHTDLHPGGEIRGQLLGLTRPDDPVGTFTDDDGNVHEGNIEAIAGAAITRGCNPPDNDRYCPDSDLTRGQMAALLRRALNLPTATESPFVDTGDSEFAGDIDAIAAQGITRGCNPPENDRYCPDDPVTRAQMASFLVRALGLPASDTDHFTDDDGSVHEADINALAAAGITVGCNPPENDRYCPDDPVQRDQMASFLARALGLRGTPPSS